MDIRNTITRFGATALIGCGLVVTAIPATFAQNGEETVTHEYQDRAASHISEVWYKGETLKISGEGFLTQDRASGSTIAIKLNKGAVKIDGKDYLEVTANDKGEFTVSIPWQNDLEDRVSVDVYLLSGSLKDNDTSRGGKAATVKIEARSVAPESPSASASAEPSVSASASASASATAELKKDPAEEPKADASASPSASATAADETVASVDAQVKNRADEKASASASVSPSATASASASTLVSSSASAEAKKENEKKVGDQKNGSQQAPVAQDQLGGSSNVQASATEQPSAESTRFANCTEVAAAGLAPIPSSHPDFRKKFDADNNGLGCEVVDNGSSSDGSSSSNGGSSSQDGLDSGVSGSQDRLDSSSSNASLSSRAQRSSLANTGASNVFTVSGLGLVALGLGVAGVTAVLRRKNS